MQCAGGYGKGFLQEKHPPPTRHHGNKIKKDPKLTTTGHNLSEGNPSIILRSRFVVSIVLESAVYRHLHNSNDTIILWCDVMLPLVVWQYRKNNSFTGFQTLIQNPPLGGKMAMGEKKTRGTRISGRGE